MTFVTAYQPSPLEKAYSRYIIETIFHSPVPLKLSGRQAVPFLSSSGVDRRLLREIWSYVDPMSMGSLLSELQLQAALKLVALAQQGRLDLNQAEGQLVGWNDIPLARFTALQEMPSAAWLLSRYVSLGSADDPTTTFVAPLTTPTERLSVSDAFGGIMGAVEDAPLPSLEPQQEPQPQQTLATTNNESDDFGGFEAAPVSQAAQVTQEAKEFGEFASEAQASGQGFNQAVASFGSVNHTLRSVSNAFGASDNAASAPLPFLSTTEKTNEVPKVEDEDEFGGFESTPAPSVTTAANPVPLQSLSDAFGSLHSIPDAPLPTLGETLPSPSIVSTGGNDLQKKGDDEDDFGGFESVPAYPVPSETVVKDEFGGFASATNQSTGTDFGGFESVPTTVTSEGPASQPNDEFGGFASATNQTTNDDFGGFKSTPDPDASDTRTPLAESDFGGFTAATNQPAADTLSGAFDSVAPVQDKPLPSLSDFSRTVSVGTTEIESKINQADQDEFGDFDEAAPTTTNPDTPATGQSSDPLSNTFGDLPSVQDRPLPSLGAFGADAIQSQTNQSDEFGDFGEATPSLANDTATPIASSDPLANPFGGLPAIEDRRLLPSLGDLADAAPNQVKTKQADQDEFGDFDTAAPITTSDEPTTGNASDPLSSAFGDLPSVQDKPLPSLGDLVGNPAQVQPATNQSDQVEFGDFDEAAPTTTTDEPAVGNASDPSSSAFGELPSVQDKPLPPFGDFVANPAQAQPETNQSDQDEFGDFDEAAPSSETTTGNASDPLGSAFGELPSVQDRPLPSLGDLVGNPTPAQPETKRTDQDEFGDFDEAAPSTETITGNASDPLSSAFGELPSSQDRPLPSLGDLAKPAQSETNQSDQDEFGDFDEAAPTTTSDEPTNQFGDFSEPVTNQSELQLDVTYSNTTAKSVSDDFGDFSTPAASTNVDPDPFSSAFDGLSAVQDKPLPSLSSFSSNSQAENVRTKEIALVAEGGQVDRLEAKENPLSSLSEFAPAGATQLEQSQMEEQEEFGGFSGPGPSHSSSRPDLFPPLQGKRLPSLDTSVKGIGKSEGQQSQKEATMGDDDFAGFSSAEPTPSSSASYTISNTFDQEQGSQAPASRADLTSGRTVVDQDESKVRSEEDDGFSGFSEAPAASTHSDIDIFSSAFDGLSEVHDRALPSLSEFTATETSGAKGDGKHQEESNDNVDHEFGDFTVQKEGTQEQSTNDLDIFTSFSEATTPEAQNKAFPSASGLMNQASGGTKEEGDLGGFPEIQDEPLPSLAEFPSPAIGTKNTNEEDDFGGFTAAAAAAPSPSLVIDKPQVDSEDDFGGFAGAQEAPTTTTSTFNALSNVQTTSGPLVFDSVVPGQEQTEADNDDFGGFTEAKAAEEPTGFLPDKQDSTDGTDDDDFGEFEHVEHGGGNETPSQAHPSFGADASQDGGNFGSFATFVEAPTSATETASSTNKTIKGNDPATTDMNFFATASSPPATNTAAFDLIGSQAPSKDKEDEQVADENNGWGSSEEITKPKDDFVGIVGETEKNEHQQDDDEFQAFRTESKASADKEDFGEFGPPPPNLPPPPPTAEAQDDSWDFDNPMGSPSGTPGQITHKGLPPANTNSGDLGQFASFDQPVGGETETGFGEFGPSMPRAHAFSEDGFAEFGAFSGLGTAPAPILGGANKQETGGRVNEPSDELDDFADFQVAGESEEVIPGGSTGADRVEGNIASQGFEVDFGDFERPRYTEDFASETKPSNDTPKDSTEIGGPKGAGAFDELSRFSNPTALIEASGFDQLRRFTGELSRRLPLALQTRLDNKKSVDFVKLFDKHIEASTRGLQMKSNGNDQTRLARARRSCNVMIMLTSTHEKLAVESWKRVITVVRDELTMGGFLMEEAGSLPQADKQDVREPLRMLLLGMGEYVRVVRLIGATIGDMLVVKVKGELNKESVGRKWSSISLLYDLLEIEQSWEKMVKQGTKLGLSTPKIDEIPEMRAKSLLLFPTNPPLCQLTLQPLSEAEKMTTRAPVEWQGKQFMACCANLWTNKITTGMPP